jgi:L-2-hydroxyglutarate oxidase LhgO
MNDINIPLRRRIVRIIFAVIGVAVFSVFYFFTNLKTMDSNIRVFKERADGWKQKVLMIRKKIAETEKEIQYKQNQISVAFSDEEINELADVYSSVCKYIFEKYKIKCVLQGINKDPNYINVVEVNIEVPTGNFKDTIVAANILSYFTNKFIALKTNIKIKEIKTIGDDKVVIELYKGDFK